MGLDHEMAEVWRPRVEISVRRVMHRLQKVLSIAAAIGAIAVAPACVSDDAADGEGLGPAAALEPNSAVVTMADGTVYEFEMTRCETSNNTDLFELEPAFHLEGESATELDLVVERGRFGEPAFAIGSITGPRDGAPDDHVFYGFNEADSVIELDGEVIRGELMMASIGGDPIHGEETSAALTVRC